VRAAGTFPGSRQINRLTICAFTSRLSVRDVWFGIAVSRERLTYELDTWYLTALPAKKQRIGSQCSVHRFPDLVFPFQNLSFGAVLRKGQVTRPPGARKIMRRECA
jgi:hypothetical protein